jgi:hypothetical protein
MWCQKRITSQDLLARFGDGKHRFYLESVCGAKVHEGKLCDYCNSIVPQTRTQDVRTFPHGYVSAEYTKESHIFDSPWYHAKVKAYGPPIAETIELAMEAQKRARAGRKTKKVADLITEPQAEVAAAEATIAVTQPSSPKKEVAKKTPRKSKKETVATPVLEHLAAPPTEQIITRIPSGTVLAETTDTPLRVEEVIRVTLRPFTHNSVQYWRDTQREKLYRRTKEGGKGEYVGRWDSDASEIVRDAPDSDSDTD